MDVISLQEFELYQQEGTSVMIFNGIMEVTWAYFDLHIHVYELLSLKLYLGMPYYMFLSLVLIWGRAAQLFV